MYIFIYFLVYFSRVSGNLLLRYFVPTKSLLFPSFRRILVELCVEQRNSTTRFACFMFYHLLIYDRQDSFCQGSSIFWFTQPTTGLRLLKAKQMAITPMENLRLLALVPNIPINKNGARSTQLFIIVYFSNNNVFFVIFLFIACFGYSAMILVIKIISQLCIQ